jgi:hypothetical protein
MRVCAGSGYLREPGMTGCGSADPGRISEVSTERGTTGSGRNLCAGP